MNDAPCTPNTPETCDFNARTPSDFELASNDGGENLLQEVPLDIRGDDALDNANAMRAEQAPKQTLSNVFDIGNVKDKEIKKVASDIRRYLELHGACGRRRFQIRNEEACAVWEARQAAQYYINGRCENEQLAVALGELLLKIEARVCSRADVCEDEVREEDVQACRDAAQNFLGLCRMREVYFDCSMLQKMVKNGQGQIKWEDMTCEDADDFKMLW